MGRRGKPGKEGREMPSPFPGMNPYLEQAEVRRDFHTTFVVACREALRPQVGSKYIVRLREHRYPYLVPAGERMEGSPEVDVERLLSVEIFEANSRRHVTTVEVLSAPHKSFG